MKTTTQLDEKIATLEDKIKNVDKELQGSSLVFTRITGYYRYTENFNSGKKQEFLERLEYELK